MKDKITFWGTILFGVLFFVFVVICLGTASYNQSKMVETVNLLSKDVTDGWELYDSTVTRLKNSIADYDKLNEDYQLVIAENKNNTLYEFFATGYTIDDPEQGTTNINASGWDLHDERFTNIPQVAADWNILPQYSLIEIVGWGIYMVTDNGGAIKGFKLDILCPDKAVALEINQPVMVRILMKGITINE